MGIDCNELLYRLADEDVLVVDCRSRDDWDGCTLHIPGALRMTPFDISECAQELPDDELIVLYGWNEDGADAMRAARILAVRGRAAVWLEGGLRAWVSAGFPTERHGREGELSAQTR